MIIARIYDRIIYELQPVLREPRMMAMTTMTTISSSPTTVKMMLRRGLLVLLSGLLVNPF